MEAPMDDLRELYQSTILDHNKKPRNFRVLEEATHEADGHNPLCGDQLTVYARVDEDGRIEAVSFQGSGCAISRASASLMTDALEGKTLEEAQALFDRFHELLTSSVNVEAKIDELGKLAVFAGVREYPMRVKCATLAWHALQSALEGDGETVRTE